MSIMLAAADLGIGSAHAAVRDQELARLLGVPEDRFCAWLITLGVPADRPLTPIRRPNRRPFAGNVVFTSEEPDTATIAVALERHRRAPGRAAQGHRSYRRGAGPL